VAKIDGKSVFRWFRNTFAVLISLAVIGGIVYVIRNGIENFAEVVSTRVTSDDYISSEQLGDEVEITIPAGASGSEIAQILVDADVVKTTSAFIKAAAANSDSESIQPGRYLLHKQVPASLAITMLLDPAYKVKNQFRIIEGRWLSWQVDGLVESTGVAKEDFEKAFKDTKAAGVPSWSQGKTVEGFLFPDTYDAGDKPSADVIVKNAVKQFDNVAKSISFEEKAAAIGVTPWEALIVASIIEREVFRDEDRPKVARVIYNRLEKGMKLQMDSTVAYANDLKGTVWTTKKQRALKSKYNTYKYEGLPIGPICSPSKKALQAAINPASGEWLYFQPIDLDTGETIFEDTIEEHNKDVKKLNQWCKASEENAKKCA
jgi:UPF0755 protein